MNELSLRVGERRSSVTPPRSRPPGRACCATACDRGPTLNSRPAGHRLVAAQCPGRPRYNSRPGCPGPL